jgi:Flp pilus assembly protein TadG
MRIPVRGSRREDGAVAITVALFAVILVVLVAFTTDFGMAYAQRQALATGADSAALAVVHAKYTVEMADPTHPTCDQLVANDAALAPTDPAKASTIALAQVNANAPFGATIPSPDVITVLSCNSAAKVLQVRVTVNRTISPIFGGVVSASPLHIDRTALAALGVGNGVHGLMPIGLCFNQADAIIAQHEADVAANLPESAQLVSQTKVWAGATAQCGTGGAGNWGWLDLGQGTSSAKALGDLITSGADTGALTLNTTTTPPSYSVPSVPGDKANNANTKAAMLSIMDTTQTFLVYSLVTGSGNVVYTVYGFLSVKLCGFDINTLGKCYDPTVPMGANDLQIRYVDFTPAGNFGQLCEIGSSCAFNGYITKLLAPPSP